MKSLNIICSSNHSNIAISAVVERSMDVASKRERMNYKYEYGSRMR